MRGLAETLKKMSDRVQIPNAMGVDHRRDLIVSPSPVLTKMFQKGMMCPWQFNLTNEIGNIGKQRVIPLRSRQEVHPIVMFTEVRDQGRSNVQKIFS